MPSLDDVLRPSQQTALTDRRQRDMGGRRPVSTTLDDALLKTGKTAISTGDKPGESSVAPSRRKFASIALGGLTVALVASVLLFRPNPSLPDSEVARRLLTVVEDIARYKKQNNRLPQRLSELPGFPQDAVEWPIEDYAVRLASPKMEFFFVDAPGGYIVIARFADEVWVFDSLKAKPLRRESPG